MTRCSICDPNCRFVAPDGPEPCEFLFIGEKPGREEDGKGIPFVGDAGKEFNFNYLRLAGLGRDYIRISNTVKCRLGGNNTKPTADQIRACAGHHLPSEIRLVNPRVIVLMGATACSLVPDIELDKDHGIPKQIAVGECKEFFGDWGGWVWPMFHPAAGMHDTGMMIPLLEDFERLKEWRHGRWIHKTSNREVEYSIIRDRQALIRSLEDGVSQSPAIDTEDDLGRLWSVQYSVRPHTGYLIESARVDLLRYLFDAFPEFIFHYAAHDIGILETLGITFGRLRRYRDTMQEAYHLGNLPQGLKALSWRLRGIRMQSWEDLVMPDSRRKAIEWLNDQWNHESDNRVKVETQLKTKVRVEWKPNDAERAIKRILSHSHKPTYDIWEKVSEADLANISSPIPRPSIAHVDLNKAVYYACQDADVTGQVASELARIRQELTDGDWNIRKEDWDR